MVIGSVGGVPFAGRVVAAAAGGIQSGAGQDARDDHPSIEEVGHGPLRDVR
jgi:hypothetical protein